MNKLKITILSLSMITVLAAAAVSPALGAIAQYFSQADPLLIKLIVTLPGLSIIVTSLSVNTFIKKYESKKVAIVGLALFTAGSIAGIADNLYVILGFRILLGVGVGLVMPLSTALISFYLEKDEHEKLMGHSVAVNNLGGIVGTLLSGLLVSINWRYTFAIYLLGIVIIVMVILFLPKTEIKRTSSGIPRTLMRSITPHLLFLLLIMTILNVVPTSFSIIVTREKLIPTAFIGAVMSVLNLAAFITGMSVSKIVRRTGRYTLLIAGVMFAAGFFALSLTGSVLPALCGLFFIGATIGVIVSVMQTQIARRSDREHLTAAMAVTSAVLFLGQFISPIVIAAIQSALNWQDIRAPYYLAMALSVLLILTFPKVPITAAGEDRA